MSKKKMKTNHRLKFNLTIIITPRITIISSRTITFKKETELIPLIIKVCLPSNSRDLILNSTDSRTLSNQIIIT